MKNTGKKMVKTIILAVVMTSNTNIKNWKINRINFNTYNLTIDSSQQYQNSFNTMIDTMIQKKDLLYTDPQDTNNNNELFKVANKNNSNQYLIIKESYEKKVVNFIIEPKYWYLEGFVPLNQSSDLTYYYFNKAKISSLPWVKKNISLHYGGDYYSLAEKTKDIKINKNELSKSFLTLYQTKTTTDIKTSF